MKEKYLRQRADGRWEARVPDGVTAEGRTHYADRCFRSRAEARAFIAETLRAASRDRVVLRSGMRLDDWAAQCLEIYGPGLQAYTVKGYESKIRNYLTGTRLAGMALEEVRTAHIQQWVNGLRKADGSRLAPKTVRLAVGVVVWLFSRAVESGIIDRAPDTAHLRLPPAEKPTRRVMDPATASALLRGTEGSRIHAALVVDACTGLRRSELLGLSWQDIDLETGDYLVRRKVTIGADGEPQVVEMLKTRSAQRIGQLPPAAVKALREHRRRLMEERLMAGSLYQDEGLCFPDELGRPTHPQAFSASLRRLGVKAVGREVGLHELRHMVATALIRAHLDDATIANALGHRNADFTRRIYADVYEDSREQVAAVTASLVDIQ